MSTYRVEYEEYAAHLIEI